MSPELRPLFILLALLILFTLVVFGVSLYILTPGTPTGPMITPVREIVVPPPPRTTSNSTKALNKTIFNVLVSYVDNNFEPRTATIKTGDTIRFTNNGTANLELCSTTFTSCTTLKSGEYFQFTFTKAGTWSYENKLTSAQGSVVVQ